MSFRVSNLTVGFCSYVEMICTFFVRVTVDTKRANDWIVGVKWWASDLNFCSEKAFDVRDWKNNKKLRRKWYKRTVPARKNVFYSFFLSFSPYFLFSLISFFPLFSFFLFGRAKCGFKISMEALRSVDNVCTLGSTLRALKKTQFSDDKK